VLSTFGVESESELSFAGLHLLLHPLLERVDRLPPRQADALRGAFGLGPATFQDRFLIGLAALTLLSEHDGPVLCLIDDAQWLDQASTDALTFAARRLDAEGIAMVIATRADTSFPGIPRLRLERLSEEAATAVLDEHAAAMSPQSRRRILDEADGNPLALLELSTVLTEEQRAGHMGPLPSAVDAAPPSSRVQRTFRDQIALLPAGTQAALLVAAADDTGDRDLVLRAAAHLGAGPAALGTAEQAGLVHVAPAAGGAPAIRFRHPLIRSTVYQGAPHHLRTAAHLALAEELPAERHADRRAWHLAAAASGPDEEVAAHLERAAVRARERQDAATASATFARAAALSIDDSRKAGRLVEAAELAARAGQLHRARSLIDGVDGLTEDPDIGSRADHVRAWVEFEKGSPGRAGHILIEGARRAADRPTAIRMLVEAARNASFSSDSGLARETAAVLRELRHPLAPGLETVARVIDDEAVSDLSPIRAAAAHLAAAAQDDPALPLLACSLSLMAGDDVMAVHLGESLTAHCREHGLVGLLPSALALLAQARMLAGGHQDAMVAATEALRVAADVGQAHRVRHLSGIRAWLHAIAGEAERVEALAGELRDGVEAGRVMGAWALGLLHLGLGDATRALDHLTPLWHDGRRHQTVALYAAPDLIEAAVRADRPDLATEPLSRFECWAGAVDRPWAHASAARSRGLLAGDAAQEHFRAALDIHANGEQRFEHARTQLVYGEWLRRRKQRTDARRHLQSAIEMFDQLGARAWVRRAQVELQAVGSRAVSRISGPVDRLTPQEVQVVRLAAAGMSNREAAGHLFLSPRTIEAHLYKAYRKLGVSSRAELADLDLAR
jgi:DNA-binding CsgD family transcriptional regulator